ncbi:MAG: hypothetical protein RI897_1, partial [Verrucomicrobiota bacterium]
ALVSGELPYRRPAAPNCSETQKLRITETPDLPSALSVPSC